MRGIVRVTSGQWCCSGRDCPWHSLNNSVVAIARMRSSRASRSAARGVSRKHKQTCATRRGHPRDSRKLPSKPVLVAKEEAAGESHVVAIRRRCRMREPRTRLQSDGAIRIVTNRSVQAACASFRQAGGGCPVGSTRVWARWRGGRATAARVVLNSRRPERCRWGARCGYLGGEWAHSLEGRRDDERLPPSPLGHSMRWVSSTSSCFDYSYPGGNGVASISSRSTAIPARARSTTTGPASTARTTLSTTSAPSSRPTRPA